MRASPVLHGDNTNPQFRVLGIALVVEGVGKGARLAFRYPVTAPDGGASSHPGEDLFFTLPPRVIAKLFRPKKPLCGQPMTVSVGGTVFCCRAVLFEDSSSDDDNNTSNLVLFSVIVAVTPFLHTSAIPISGWFDAESLPSPNTTDDGITKNKERADSGRIASVSFRSIRRVHVSLARLCRVLEREERRCHYVSIQSSHLLQLRNDLGLNEEGTAAPTNNHGQNAVATSSSSVVSTTTNTAPSDAAKKRHRRLGSGSMGPPSSLGEVGGNGDHHHTTADFNTHRDALLDQQEREQEALEVMLAAQPSEEVDGKQVHGNLARELAQTFHALSRNDHCFAPTAAGLLSGQDGIVYINRHVAVPIEPISGDSIAFSSISASDSRHQKAGVLSMMDSVPIIRPYHTLLFPHASPSEYLETLSKASATTHSAPKKLEQLLLMTNPRKPLSDISIDAALTIPLTLQLAGYLVSHGTCVVSPVLTRSSRFACRQNAVEQMRALSLGFCQWFGPQLPIFLVVSALTNNDATLGEIMSRTSSSMVDDEDEILNLLGDKIAASLGQASVPPGLVTDKGRDLLSNPGGSHLRDQGLASIQNVEEAVYSMAAWLRSHLVIVEMKDYLVSIGKITSSSVMSDVAGGVSSDSGGEGDKKETTVMSESVKSSNSLMERDRTSVWGSSPEEALYYELLDGECLNGNISTVAMCWKFGLDVRRLHRFRTWGLRHNKIRVVTRTPTTGDDWGAA